LRITTKKVVGKLTENLGPHWLPFGGGGAHSGLRRNWLQEHSVVHNNSNKKTTGHRTATDDDFVVGYKGAKSFIHHALLKYQ